MALLVGVPSFRDRMRFRIRAWFRSFPWLPDTAYGVMTAGLGRVVLVHREELQNWGWAFLQPLAWIVGPLMMIAGTMQSIAALLKWHGWRRAFGGLTFLLYWSISSNTPSSTGHWIYRCIAWILLGVLARVY